MEKQSKKIYFTEWFLIVSLVLGGLFHEFLACLAGGVMSIWLLWQGIGKKEFRIFINPTSIAIFFIVVSYALTAFWAVDQAAAVWGFFKFFPLLLTLFAFMQDVTCRERCYAVLPHVSVFMTILSMIFMQIPILQKYFAVSGRLAGFFQYPNTFALLLLVSIVLLATKEKLQKLDFLYFPILLFGIFYSGSRTVFALTIFSILILILHTKNKKIRISLLLTIGVLLLGTGIYVAVTKDFSAIGRFLTASMHSSTFLGRLLYYKDALPLILKHPFGLGYLGYSYLQTGIQTGVYTVRFIHNDILQLLLDVGWIPTIAFLIALATSFFKKGTSFKRRMLLFLMVAHCCFDFDLQYLAMFIILVLTMDFSAGKAHSFKMPTVVSICISSAFLLLFLYIGTAQGLAYFKAYEASAKLYPWNTQTQMILLNQDTPSEQEKRANRILKNNAYVPIAYRIKARTAFSKGDFKNAMLFERKAIQIAPFSYDTYEEYAKILIQGYSLYGKMQDRESMRICAEELIHLKEKLYALPEKQSKLGKQIKDQPTAIFPYEIENRIEELQNEVEK